MGAIHKIVIYSLAALGLVYLILLGSISFGPISGCEVTDIRKAVSPGSGREAKLVVRDCPDEADPMLVLSLASPVAANQSQMVVLGIATTTTDADITWLSDAALQVSHPASFRIMQHPMELDGIAVKFVSKPAPASPRTDARAAR